MKKIGAPFFKGQNRGIAFDMDGVIIDSMKYHVKSWKDTFYHFFNFHVDDIEIYLLEGLKGKDIIKKITSEHQIFLDSKKISEVHDYKRNLFNNIFLLEPIPGIFDLINLVSNYEYKIALVTGTSRRIAIESISSLDLLNFFQTIITGDDNIKGKPSPDPYLLAAKRLGIRNDLVLVIENAPEGIKSAKSANMPCIAVQTTLDKKILSQANKILPNINEVKNTIEREYRKSKGFGPWIL